MLTLRRSVVGMLVVLLVVCGVAGAQTVPTVVGQAKPRIEPIPKIPASEPRQSAPTTKPKAPCPDGAFQKACDSYAELLKAHDAEVSPKCHDSTFNVVPCELVMICFRSDTDSFFVVDISPPQNATIHLDRDTRKFVPNDATAARGYGRVIEFTDGINNGRQMPIQNFTGFWMALGGRGALEFGANDVDDDPADEHSSVSVVTSNVLMSHRYKNRSDKNIDYALVIQRSTGRFSEKYTEEKALFPFSEHLGRCAVPPIR